MGRQGTVSYTHLHSIGLLDRNVIAAHCVWLNPKEIELLARTGTSIGHCPKSNLKLASGVADIDTYLKAGITVALGTDGTASNNTLDLVEEMRFAALLAKVVHYNPEAVKEMCIRDSQTVMRFPDTLQIKSEELEDTEWEALEAGIKKALEEINKFRIQEGKALIKDICHRIELIQELSAQVPQFEVKRVEVIRQKLQEKRCV